MHMSSLIISPLISHTFYIFYHTTQKLGNGNISEFMDGDELNVQDSVLVDQVSTLTLLKLLFVLKLCLTLHSLTVNHSLTHIFRLIPSSTTIQGNQTGPTSSLSFLP